MLIHLLYYFFAGLVVMAGLCILITPQILYAALCLVPISIGLAAIYFLQGASFIAVSYLIIYGGEVLAMLLFSLFMLQSPMPNQAKLRYRVLAVIGLGIGLAPLLWLSISLLSRQGELMEKQGLTITVASLGYELFGPYALLIEIASMLLLLVLVGVLYMVRGISMASNLELLRRT